MASRRARFKSVQSSSIEVLRRTLDQTPDPEPIIYLATEVSDGCVVGVAVRVGSRCWVATSAGVRKIEGEPSAIAQKLGGLAHLVRAGRDVASFNPALPGKHPRLLAGGGSASPRVREFLQELVERYGDPSEQLALATGSFDG